MVKVFFLNYCQNTHNIRFMVLVVAATTITKYQGKPSTTVSLFPAHSSRNLQLTAHNAGGQKLAAAFFVTAGTKTPVNTWNC
jgi:ABC-type multidrug transport system permease subunit